MELTRENINMVVSSILAMVLLDSAYLWSGSPSSPPLHAWKSRHNSHGQRGQASSKIWWGSKCLWSQWSKASSLQSQGGWVGVGATIRNVLTRTHSPLPLSAIWLLWCFNLHIPREFLGCLWKRLEFWHSGPGLGSHSYQRSLLYCLPLILALVQARWGHPEDTRRRLLDAWTTAEVASVSRTSGGDRIVWICLDFIWTKCWYSLDCTYVVLGTDWDRKLRDLFLIGRLYDRRIWCILSISLWRKCFCKGFSCWNSCMFMSAFSKKKHYTSTYVLLGDVCNTNVRKHWSFTSGRVC